MTLGGLAGGADALMQVLQQKLQEEQLRRSMKLRERAFEESLKPQAPEPLKPMAVGGRIVDPNTGKVIFEAPPEPKAPRAPIPVSGNSRLFDPDTGKVLLDQVQEPEKPQALPRPMSVAPGGRIVDPITGKVIFAAPERPQTPEKPDKPGAPQIFFDTDGKPRAVQFRDGAFIEVPLPPGIAGKTPPKPAGKTPAEIEAEAAARARGAVTGKQEAGGGGLLDAIGRVFGGGDKPKTIRARDPQGKLHEAPAGTALPAGWKLEK